jgi:response regulator RpfG family c-di-GMP phosphodiesterase
LAVVVLLPEDKEYRVMEAREHEATTTVLLVDEEPLHVELRASVMRLVGFSVATACGPTQAIAVLAQRAQSADIAVLDYNLPFTNGCALADLLKAVCPGLRVILYSGATDISAEEMCGVDAFISKWDGIELLLAQMAELSQLALHAPMGRASGSDLLIHMRSGQA